MAVYRYICHALHLVPDSFTNYVYIDFVSFRLHPPTQEITKKATNLESSLTRKNARAAFQFLFAATRFLFAATRYFYLQQLVIFICSNSLFLFAATCFICNNLFFICSNCFFAACRLWATVRNTTPSLLKELSKKQLKRCYYQQQR